MRWRARRTPSRSSSPTCETSRVLFQSDLWFPGTGGAGNPAARHLLESVRKLGLRVDTHVGGHGGVAPFAELVTAVGKMP